MTASRWRICSATTRSTTRPMARTIATAPATITATIAAMKARPTIRRSSRCGASLRKNQLACLLLAQGVPLILAGDEVGNTQNGNNNAYCQDNEIGWVGWEGLDREGDDLTDFVGHMTELAPALSANPLAPLARRPARRRLLRRAVADAGGRRDDRAGLEFSGRPISRLCARARSNKDRRRSSSCSTPRPKRSRSNCRRCPNTRAGSRC